MKRIFGILIALAIIFGVVFAGCEFKDPPKTSTQVSNENNEKIALAAQTAYPTPIVQNFIERKTVYEWVKRWDVPMIITYIYLFANDKCIGYFVCDGKPASTRSYLEPEERYYMSGATLQTPSLDGTFGQDNPGWIFFTADGTAVSWQGQMANILFSDAPLPQLSAVRLGKLKAE